MHGTHQKTRRKREEPMKSVHNNGSPRSHEEAWQHQLRCFGLLGPIYFHTCTHQTALTNACMVYLDIQHTFVPHFSLVVCPVFVVFALCIIADLLPLLLSSCSLVSVRERRRRNAQPNAFPPPCRRRKADWNRGVADLPLLFLLLLPQCHCLLLSSIKLLRAFFRGNHDHDDHHTSPRPFWCVLSA